MGITPNNLDTAELLEKTIASVDDVVVLVDAASRTIIGINQPVQRVFGYQPDELIGQSTEILHIDREHFLRFGNQSSPELDRHGKFQTRYYMKRKDGVVIPTEHSIVEIKNGNTERIAVVSVIRDMSNLVAVHNVLSDTRSQLDETERKYQALIEQIPAVTYTALPDDFATVIYISPQVEDELGYTPEEVLNMGHDWVQRIHPQDRPRVLNEIHEQTVYGKPLKSQYRMYSKQGETVWLEDRAVTIVDKDNRPLIHQGVLYNITPIVEMTQELQESREHYRTVIESANEGVVVLHNGTLVFANQHACEISGYPSRELLGMAMEAIVHPDDLPLVEKYYEQRIHGIVAPRKYRFRILTKGNRTRWCETNAVTIKWDGKPAVLGFMSDITEQLLAQSQIEHLTNHDSLTGLPNRNLLIDRIGLAISQGKRRSQLSAVLLINIDHFQLVNESAGHQKADQVLVEFGAGFRSVLRDEDTISRLGGDEFGILLHEVRSKSDVEHIVQKLHHVCERLREQHQLPFITLSIGVALHPQDDDSPTPLMQKASISMDYARLQGRNCTRFFEPAFSNYSSRRTMIQQDLQKALKEEQFVLHFQPKIDCRTDRVAGCEALLRWQHPVQGMIPPGEFIEELELTGLILPVGEWVVEKVCQTLKHWESQQRPLFPIAINVSQRQWCNPEFTEHLFDVFERYDVDTHFIELEITESIPMLQVETTSENLGRLNRANIRIAIDDFGTGYSSLGYLHYFTSQTLKIDRVFIENLDREENSLSIIKAIVAMGRSLGMTIVAEGVETLGQLNRLIDLGCNQVQGYYIAKPLPLKEFEDFVANYDNGDPYQGG